MHTIDRGDYEVCYTKKPYQTLKDLLRVAEKKLDLVWRFETGEEITSLCVAHYLEHDELKKQVIVGSKDCNAYALSIDKELLWKFCAKDEILSLCTLNLNGYSSQEIIVGSKDHYIYILDSGGRLLRSYQCEGPIKAITVAEGEEQPFIVAGSSNGYIYFLGHSDGPGWKYYCGDNTRVNGLCVAPLGENGQDKIIAVTSQGDVIILDYHERKLWRRFKKPGSLYAVIAKDIDNDGINEIVVSSDSCCVYALNSYGLEKWRFKTKDSVYSIHCCDIDIDNRFEVVIGTKDDYVYVLNAEGKYEWKYKTDHNVWSLYSAPFSRSDLRFCDLFAGLSNRMVYYYRLRDWHHYANKIDEYYTSLLTEKGEWEILETFSKDDDEYLRQFAAQKMVALANGHPLTQDILMCLRNMLKDPSPRIRATAVSSLTSISEYNPDLVIKILSTETAEQDEAVRHKIIQGMTSIASSITHKRGDIFNHLQRLSQQWDQIDRKAIINLLDVARNEFITGNLTEALIDFHLLAERGIDLVSKYKTDGYVCALTCGDMGLGKKIPVIALASRNNHLYVFDHWGRLRWDKLTETYAQRIFIEDVDKDGQLEIVVGGAHGDFQFFSESGEEKGGFIFSNQVNDFYPVKSNMGKVEGFVIVTPDGMVYYVDLFGREQWHFQTKACILSVYADDIDHDGHQEIAVSTLHGHLFLLEHTGKLRWEKNFQSDIRAINSLRSEVSNDLIIGTRNWKIYALDSLGNIKWLQSADQVINKIWISHLHDRKTIVVATQGASLLMLDAQGNKRGKIETFESITALACVDINRDGQKEIILGTQDDHLYIYKFIDKQEVDTYIKRCQELSEILGKKISFPRNDILKLIKVNFESRERKTKVVLVGYLGSGKTNLLWQISSGALGTRYLPVYINLQYTKLNSLGDFLWDFAEKVTKDLSGKGVYPFCPSKAEFSENYLETFKEFFKTLSSQLEDRILLILLDDFDRLQSEVSCENISYDVFHVFEDMINTDKCYFVLTASSYDFDLDKKGGNVFLNNSLIKDVNFVDKFTVQQELFRQLGDDLEDKEELVNKILEITGSQVHYLQIAFNILINYLEKTKKDRLTNKDWSHLYFSIMEAIEEELLNPWETSSPWEKVVLSSLARLSPYGATIVEIKKNLGLFTSLLPIPI